MSLKTFSLVEGSSVTINSSAVACFYPHPTREEVVTIELLNGSKFTVKDVFSDLEKWLQRS